MLTLFRPTKSINGDLIEALLREITAAYQVIFKEISESLYLTNDGEVIEENKMQQYLECLGRELTHQRDLFSDSREIG